LFEHCARAIDCSLATGAHGLPLIGTGDWNDGMNRVGREGRGESVWLGWFLYATLVRFAQTAADLGHGERAARWSDHARKLQQALEREAWDGAWYRRAYFDDGTPLGSASSAECRIDSLAQSWSVISGAGDLQRARRAMQSVEEYLVRPGDDLILLFTPPFDKTSLDPGYIKGYLPGVRENGGQYTHAAVWCAIAVAGLGEGDAANELFRMLNPINRTATRAGVHAYKVEPYVVAADIYSEPRMSAAADGPGIPGPPVGCIVPVLSGSWACRRWPAVCIWTHAFPASGGNIRSSIVSVQRCTRLRSKTQTG
jgi:cyclic beta-1,2-glucan synthetase